MVRSSGAALTNITDLRYKIDLLFIREPQAKSSNTGWSMKLEILILYTTKK